VIRPTHVDVNHVVAEADRMLRRLVGSNIEFVALFNASSAWVIGDPTQLEQVVVNLVVNARDAMPDGGRLVVETANLEIAANDPRTLPEVEPGSYVLLSVADNGVGIDPDTTAHLFEPFYTTKEVGKGTGLGLATTYGIVQHGGGHISVESTPGIGSRFTVYLPRAADAPAEAAPEPDPRSSLTGDETVLLVEDVDTVRALVRRTLESYGYTVLEARYADEALAVADRTDRRIDLLLTDVVMPGISGVELANQLLAARRVANVLFMSGYVDAGDTRRDLAAGTLPFLQKPFTPETLARTVRQLLDSSSS
jgi:CheY-like chemotaxis protein